MLRILPLLFEGGAWRWRSTFLVRPPAPVPAVRDYRICSVGYVCRTMRLGSIAYCISISCSHDDEFADRAGIQQMGDIDVLSIKE